MKNWKKFVATYRKQGCPNGQRYYLPISAPDMEFAEMEAYSQISENYTILDICEVDEAVYYDINGRSATSK